MTDKRKISILEWPCQSPDLNPVEKPVNYRAALLHVPYVILRIIYLYAVFFFFFFNVAVVHCYVYLLLRWICCVKLPPSAYTHPLGLQSTREGLVRYIEGKH